MHSFALPDLLSSSFAFRPLPNYRNIYSRILLTEKIHLSEPTKGSNACPVGIGFDIVYSNVGRVTSATHSGSQTILLVVRGSIQLVKVVVALSLDPFLMLRSSIRHHY
jgi:hypothetical protein